MPTSSLQMALLGGLLSFLIPGLGQLVQGRNRPAALFFFAAMVLYAGIFFVSMIITESVVPWWVQAVGIGWNLVAGTEALVYALRVRRHA